MAYVAIADRDHEMAQAIGKPFAVGMYLISPFTCPLEGLEVIAAYPLNICNMRCVTENPPTILMQVMNTAIPASM